MYICHVPHDSHVQYVVHTCMSCVVHGTCMYMYVHVHVCVNVYIIYIYKQRRLEGLVGLYFSTFPHPPLTTALSSHEVVRVTHGDTYHHTTR